MDDFREALGKNLAVYLYGCVVGMISLRLGQKVYEICDAPRRKRREEFENECIGRAIHFAYDMGKVIGKTEGKTEARNEMKEQ